MIQSEVAQALWAIFGDGTQHYAEAYFDLNTVAYKPIKEPLTVPAIIKHLNHDCTLGAYQLLPDSTVRWIAWDVDSPKIETARGYAKAILDQFGEVPIVCCASGGKGYHLFALLKDPVPASHAKIFAEEIREIAGVPASGIDHVEVFPKQALLTPRQPFGNLLKLPLGIHPRTHNISRFVDPANGWEIGPEIPPLEALSVRVSFSDLKDLVQPQDPIEALKRILIPVWSSGDRHDLALALSGFLATSSWGFEDALELITEIAAEAGDMELTNRRQCVKDTYRALADGRPVVGYTVLRSILPGNVFNTVISLAGQIVVPETIREIDGIRLQPKIPSFLKVRSATRTIWAHLVEGGVPLQTVTGQKYWYQRDNHQLMDLESLDWEARLADQYGFSLRDTFGANVGREVLLQFHRDAKVIDVHRRSAWVDNKLYVHLDGPQVYILDGETIQVAYNGECGIMFRNLGDTPVEILPGAQTKINVWHELIDDLSFVSDSETVQASPEEQRELLRVWLLAFFFPQFLQVRPMLVCLGAPGSGKTSALRRILHIFESPNQDVLGLVLDKPDAFRSTLARHKFIVLDNLEKTRAKWLVDILNRIVTGAEIELRKLYATNEVVRIIPDAFLAATAVALPFDEETLYSRILPIELAMITAPKAEYMLQRRIVEYRPLIWHDLIHQLNTVVKSLHEIPQPQTKYAGRLADFVLFAQRLRNVPAVRWDILNRAVEGLQSRQKVLLRDASGFVQTLEMWLEMDGAAAAQPHTVGELWKVLQPLAKASGFMWTWKSPRALSPHIRSLIDPLKKYYGLQMGETAMFSPGTKKTYCFKKDIPF